MIHKMAIRFSLATMCCLATLAGSTHARQVPAPIPNPASPTPIPDRGPITSELPGSATAGTPILPPEVQVVRISAPAGTKIEVLGPAPEPVVATDYPAPGVTIGMKVGVAY